MVDAIIGELESEYEREVPSTAIGQKVMDRLRKLDEVAYVRFASVYRRFRDANQFIIEADRLIERE
jgi:transcriptional repressor NrdR